MTSKSKGSVKEEGFDRTWTFVTLTRAMILKQSMPAIHMRSLQGDQCYAKSSSRNRNFDLGDEMLVVEAILRVVSSSFERRSLLNDN